MTAGVRCVLCDAPIAGEVRMLGGRSFCTDHYQRATRENRAAALPIALCIGGVVAFAAVVAGVATLTQAALGGAGLVLAGVVLAVVPAVIWLLAFYYQDRVEPEPKHYVLGVFLLSALLAQGIGQPVIRDLFRVQTWLGIDPVTTLLGSILVVGFVQEFLKYGAVRYTVFFSQEFDERVDGIIYGAAAGLGYATMLNIQYVIGNEGVDLGAGALRVSLVALAHASFSGVVGYFLGRAKFERMGPLWLPLGLTLAAGLNGLVTYVLGEVTTIGGLGVNLWYGLAVAAVVAGSVFVALFAIIRRLNAAALAASG